MTIDGIYYTEPEVQAYISKLQTELGTAEDYIDSRNERIAELETAIKRYEERIERLDSENYKLTEKLEEVGAAFNEQVSLVSWHEEREKEYKRLLKAAVDDFPDLTDMWRYADDIRELIGEEDETEDRTVQ